MGALRLHIVHVLQRYRPAPLTGSERYMDAMTLYMRARGHRVTVLTSAAIDWEALTRPKGRITRKGLKLDGLRVVRLMPWYPLPSLFLRMYRLLRKIGWENNGLALLLQLYAQGPFMPNLGKIIRKESPDIVNVTPFPLSYNLHVYKAAKKHGIKLVVTPFFHYKFKIFYNPYLVEIIRGANLVVAFTRYEERLLKLLGARRTHLSAMGLWVEKWITPPKYNPRQELGLDDYYIIVIPHRSPDKGSIQTLAAAALIAKRYNVKIAVISFGQFYFREYEVYKKRAQQYGVKVVDLGYISEEYKKAILYHADVLSQPSITDAYGLVYLEAWIMGKPVIAARIEAMKEVVREGVDGFLVEPGNIPELVQKLYTLIRNPDLAKLMGENGRRKVIKNNDWKVIGKKLEQAYMELL